MIYGLEEDYAFSSMKKELERKVNLASNPTTPIEVLEKLREENVISVRLALITNPSTPDKIIKDSIDDCMPVLLRRLFSEGYNISERVMRFLYESGKVNISLAMYDQTPVYMLEGLSSVLKDGLVANNPNVTTQCLLNMDYSNIKGDYFKKVIKTDVVTPEIIKKLLYTTTHSLSRELYHHKFAEIDDLVNVASQEGRNLLRSFLLNRGANGLFEKFAVHLEEKDNIDIRALSDSMISDLMGWSE
jgi:hypothetical protein